LDDKANSGFVSYWAAAKRFWRRFKRNVRKD
jgi:hypothetical protein